MVFYNSIVVIIDNINIRDILLKRALENDWKTEHTVASDKVTAEQGIFMDHLNIPSFRNVEEKLINSLSFSAIHVVTLRWPIFFPFLNHSFTFSHCLSSLEFIFFLFSHLSTQILHITVV